MRKIEQALVDAIRKKRPFRSGNTVTRYADDGACEVLLHGNVIARLNDADGRHVWTLAGWNTSTTRSRINALACALGWPGRVFSLAGLPYKSGPGAPERVGFGQWVDPWA